MFPSTFSSSNTWICASRRLSLWFSYSLIWSWPTVNCSNNLLTLSDYWYNILFCPFVTDLPCFVSQQLCDDVSHHPAPLAPWDAVHQFPWTCLGQVHASNPWLTCIHCWLLFSINQICEDRALDDFAAKVWDTEDTENLRYICDCYDPPNSATDTHFTFSAFNYQCHLRRSSCFPSLSLNFSSTWALTDTIFMYLGNVSKLLPCTLSMLPPPVSCLFVLEIHH